MPILPYLKKAFSPKAVKLANKNEAAIDARESDFYPAIGNSGEVRINDWADKKEPGAESINDAGSPLSIIEELAKEVELESEICSIVNEVSEIESSIKAKHTPNYECMLNLKGIREKLDLIERAALAGLVETPRKAELQLAMAARLLGFNSTKERQKPIDEMWREIFPEEKPPEILGRIYNERDHTTWGYLTSSEDFLNLKEKLNKICRSPEARGSSPIKERLASLSVKLKIYEGFVSAATKLHGETVPKSDLIKEFKVTRSYLDHGSVLEMLSIDIQDKYGCNANWYDKVPGVGQVLSKRIESYIVERHPLSLEALIIQARTEASSNTRGGGASGPFSYGPSTELYNDALNADMSVPFDFAIHYTQSPTGYFINGFIHCNVRDCSFGADIPF